MAVTQPHEAHDLESQTADKHSDGHQSNGSVSDEGKVEPNEQAEEPPAPEIKDEVAAPPKPAGPPGGPVPNGGTQAWLQVLGSWMLFFNTWGVLNTFGVYQTYYESGDLFVANSSNISWIGSIQSFCVLLIGFVTGPVYDRGHFRILLLIGSFGVVFGHMMLSLCTTYWQALLAQGFVIGLGGGCLFVPAVAIMPTYFSTHLGLALGIAASGSSMGGIIYPIVFYRLIDQIGFGWSVRVLGFMALATLLVPLAVMKQRVKPPRARAFFDWTAFTDLPYMTFVIGSMIGFIGLYVAFFYTSYYGQSTGITDASLSFYLVPILNAGSVFGRTLPNWLSDKTGPLNIIFPGAVICGVLLLCMLAVSNVGGIVVVTLFFGFFSGIFIALPPVLFVALTKDKSKVGTRIGMGFTMIGLGVLAGGPGGGGILGTNERNLDWNGTWIYGGVTCLVSGAIFGFLRMLKSEWKLVAKV